MANYSPEEVAEFRAKDLRISRQAVLKSLIEKLPLEDIYEVNKVTKLAEKYVDYVYSTRNDSLNRGEVSSVTNDTKPEWEQIAKGLNLATPDSQNIKMLDHIWDKHKPNMANKASANPDTILVHILNTFGKYPTKSESVEKVVKSLNESERR